MKIRAYLLCALLAGAAFAAAPSVATTAIRAQAKAAKSLSATGLIESTDMVGNTITVKGKKAQWVFAVPANTKIAAGKKTLAFADITTGSKVSVRYVKDADTLTAFSIKVLALKKTSSKK